MGRLPRALSLAGLLAATPGFAAEWCSLPQPGQLDFIFTWEGTPISGRYRDFSVRYNFDPAQPQLAQLDVRITVPSATTGSRDRDEGMAGPDWFDFASYPLARYRASGVAAMGDGTHRFAGELSLKDATRQVPVTLRWVPSDRGARMTGSATVRRLDFGIGAGEWADPDLIGLDVRVEFDLELAPCADS
jgi:polyisoprenoid-binding protein YceI